mmetsp:Transcript_15458/g.32748  ORF Transcript_15458/g.32748 Transcript_15458/m.32748 type:complete len:133 (+) Transcript_15458:492-890(+)
MLEEMIREQDRLIAKYSGAEWNAKPTANRVVELLVEHRVLIQIELNEVNSGLRKLTDRDFLGPKERRRRLKLKEKKDNSKTGATAATPQKKHKDSSKYFNKLEREANAQKKRKRRDLRRLAKKAKSEADAMP